MNVREIFTAAREKLIGSDRNAYLDEACEGNAKLRDRVEELLQAEEKAGEFLESPPPGLALTIRADDPEVFGQSLQDFTLDFLSPSDKPGCLGTIGQYEIVGLIGRGGCGLVLRGYDPKLNRIVAIKVMAPELATNPTSVKRFLREAQAAASVRHDHVVTIHAIEETSKPPFIVMEYVEGQSLKGLVDENGELEFIEILRIGQQIALGLSEAHKQGLVHRDIKPANILLENGIKRVKITDFGLARAVDDIGMTQTGMIAGTPQYMSPEQSMGKPIDARSDLFSLGSVLYTLCTGRAAFRADSAVATLRRVCDDTPRSIRAVNPQIPVWFENIVRALMEKSPDDRFQSASDVAELLGTCLRHVQSEGESTSPENVASFTFPRKSVPPKTPPCVGISPDSSYIHLVKIHLVLLLFGLICAYINIETIVLTGPIVSLFSGLAVAFSAFNSRLPWRSVAFGLSTLALGVFTVFIINAFSIGPGPSAPIGLWSIFTLYFAGAVWWGLDEIKRARSGDPHKLGRRWSVNRCTVVPFVYAIQLCCVPGVAVAGLVDWEALPVSAVAFGILLGGLLSYLAFTNPVGWQSRFFSASVPAFTVILTCIALSSNSLRSILDQTQRIENAVFFYALIVVPIGMLGLINQLGLASGVRSFRFNLRTGLMATALIAIACAGAQPGIALGGMTYVAGILFVATLVLVCSLLAYHQYKQSEPRSVRWPVVICIAAFFVQVTGMWLVSEYERSTRRGQIVVFTKNAPLQLKVAHKPSGVNFFMNIDRDKDIFGYLAGDVELSVPDNPELKVVPNKLTIGRATTTSVNIVPIE